MVGTATSGMCWALQFALLPWLALHTRHHPQHSHCCCFHVINLTTTASTARDLSLGPLLCSLATLNSESRVQESDKAQVMDLDVDARQDVDECQKCVVSRVAHKSCFAAEGNVLRGGMALRHCTAHRMTVSPARPCFQFS